jgi:hypothetical protein
LQLPGIKFLACRWSIPASREADYQEIKILTPSSSIPHRARLNVARVHGERKEHSSRETKAVGLLVESLILLFHHENAFF